MDIKGAIRISLPTLCIFYVSSFSRVPMLHPYHQVFGNNDYYLDLYFDTHPEGVLQPATSELRKVRVSGFLIQGNQEERVFGHWMRAGDQTYYTILLPKGRFVGVLVPGRPGKCEPRLRYRIEGDRAPASGTMHAGFCPAST